MSADSLGLFVSSKGLRLDRPLTVYCKIVEQLA